jgi:hypothetical protein
MSPVGLTVGSAPTEFTQLPLGGRSLVGGVGDGEWQINRRGRGFAVGADVTIAFSLGHDGVLSLALNWVGVLGALLPSAPDEGIEGAHPKVIIHEGHMTPLEK